MKTLDAYFKSILQLKPFADDGWTDDVFSGLSLDPGTKIPAAFLEPFDYSQPLDWNAVEQVAEWMFRCEAGNAKPWLFLTGCSRLGKTRTAVMAAILWSGEFSSGCCMNKFVRAVDFAAEARRPGGNAFELTGVPGDDGDMDSFSFNHYGLLLDDLDKPPFSANVIAELFNLIDHAEQNDRFLIITSQASIEELFNLLLGDRPDAQRISRAEAIINRIVDHAEVIRFEKPQGARLEGPVSPPLDSNDG